MKIEWTGVIGKKKGFNGNKTAPPKRLDICVLREKPPARSLQAGIYLFHNLYPWPCDCLCDDIWLWGVLLWQEKKPKSRCPHRKVLHLMRKVDFIFNIARLTKRCFIVLRPKLYQNKPAGKEMVGRTWRQVKHNQWNYKSHGDKK